MFSINVKKSAILPVAKAVAGCTAGMGSPIGEAVRVSVSASGVVVYGIGRGPSMRVVVTGAEVLSGGGDVYVSGRALTDAVGALGEDIRIDADDRRLTFYSGRMKTSIFLVDPAGAMEMPTVGDSDWTIEISADWLGYAVETVRWAVAPEGNKYGLDFVSIEPEGSMLRLTATDGSCLATVVVSARIDGLRSSSLPAQVLGLVGALTGNVRLRGSRGRMEVATDTTAIVCAMPSIEFPDWRQFVPTTYSHVVTVDREELSAAVAGLARSISLGGETPTARLDIGESLTFSARAVDRGEASAEVGADVVGGKMTAGVNTKNVVTALSKLTAKTVRWEFGTALSPTRMTAEGFEGFFIVMPVRLD